MRKLSFFIVLVIVVSCSVPERKAELLKGPWLFELHIDKELPELVIPFNVEVVNEGLLIVSNAEEKIEVSEIQIVGDSIMIQMPVFGSGFKGVIDNGTIRGSYFNYNKTRLMEMPFVAKHGVEARFNTGTESAADVGADWQVTFGEGEKSSPAIGIFKQVGKQLTGTFLTEIGDYRYLQGVVNGNELKLSCFDGAHAFLFEASLSGDTLRGMFYSGNTWQQGWKAVRTDNPQLGDMKSLTYLNEGYDKLYFSFPNEKGNTISLADPAYQDKVVIVQIFGTWCPNCMDETRYLVELYEKYHDRGLEIIGLDFEPRTDFDYFKKRITRFKNDLNVPYEMLLAGPANKKKAAESLPMLNHILSYPTAIFIDRSGEIVEIHTGFTGPGTEEKYYIYRKETEELISGLLSD